MGREVMAGRLLAAFILPVLLFGIIGCSKSDDKASETKGGTSGSDEPLKLTIVPYEAADKLQDEYAPMAEYLAKRVGRKSGKFYPVDSYAGVLAALKNGQVDVAYLSPFPYALATAQMELTPLAMPWVKGNLMYRGIIFVRADSPIQTLQDLKGKRFAFGDTSSTSGFILPRAILEKEGVFDTLKISNTSATEVVLQSVENGSADAGASYESVFEKVYKDTPEKAKTFRVIAKTEEIPNGIYVARAGLPPDTVEKLKKAFLDMNDEKNNTEGFASMKKAPNDKIVPAEDSLFNSVREAAKKQNLDVSVFEKKK